MILNSTTASQVTDYLFASPDDTKAKEEDPLGRDAFLTMLVAQLQHQDPLNPMEGADFSAQLAQFSSLEQQFNTNDLLEDIQGSIQNSSEENLLDYIGKQVMSEDNTITVLGGQVNGGSYHLPEAGEVMLAITDSSGQEVGRLYPGFKQAGTHEITWNGTDGTGNPVANGTYTYEIVAVTQQGALIPARAATTGQVTGVTNQNGRRYLQMDGRLIDPASVMEVWVPSETSS